MTRLPPTISLHAELLSNIRQLTLYVSLPDLPEQIERIPAEITLSTNRHAITVTYYEPATSNVTTDGSKIAETIDLPARVSKVSQKNLVFDGHQIKSQDERQPDCHRKEFSFRLQVEPEDVPDVLGDGELIDTFVPWQADDMLTCAGIVCRFCSHNAFSQPRNLQELLIDTTAICHGPLKWKNLPSGNWAEMMDFWHCHKPESQDLQEKRAVDDQNAATKGYGAANQVLATPGTILVDVGSFLVSDEDCQGQKKPNNKDSPSFSNSVLGCNNCSQIIGMYDASGHGWRLYKANVCSVIMMPRDPSPIINIQGAASILPVGDSGIDREISKTQSSPGSSTFMLESQLPETILSAQLLELIEREGVRRFVMHSGEKHGYLLWPFNTDLRFSSCSSTTVTTRTTGIQCPDEQQAHRVTSQRALKIFYQLVSDSEAILEPERGTPASFAVEEVFLPKNILDEIVQSLEKSNTLLPRCARQFKEWKVGLLARFQKT